MAGRPVIPPNTKKITFIRQCKLIWHATKNELKNLVQVMNKLKSRTILIGRTLTNVFVPTN